jgi:hypothetical protein
VSRATASVFPPQSKLIADVIFSAASLRAVVEMWRRLKKGIFDLGRWHDEVSAGDDRPETDVEG